MGEVVGRISFFVNAGVRFVEEMCKVRAFTRLWDAITRERYGIGDPAQRRFRYGVQVNSLGLTEAQPENNIQRIVLEMLAVTLSRDARARAIQLPAWNEALGLPRPVDQQWSLRIQQVLAYESDLLEYGDLFDGSPVVEAKTAELVAGAEAELAEIAELGGMIPAVESGYLKARLVASHAARRARIESGQDMVVGVNCFQATEPSPLTADLETARSTLVDPAYEQAVLAELAQWRKRRDRAEVRAALARLKAEAEDPGVNLMEATLACARAGVTTGEWASALREVFGEYRAPTGVGAFSAAALRDSAPLAAVRQAADATAARIGAGRLRLLLGKPGLDGHSNGVEQIAVRARDAGFEVIYAGIRLTPAQIAAAAVAEDVHCVGLSILSGGHAELVPDVLRRLRESGAGDIPVVVGGIIPPADAQALRAQGVAEVFTPADFDITVIVGRIVDEIRRAHRLEPSRAGIDNGRVTRAEMTTAPTAPTRLRPRRSCLAVPGSNPRFLEKAQGLPADQVFLDLEDACAPLVKESARHLIVDALNTGDWSGKTRVVRVNDWTTHWTYRDVVTVTEGAGQNLDCLMLPKVQDAGQVVALDLLLTQIEKTMGFEVGRIGIEAQIENARGLVNVDEIAAASPRLETIVFGPADFMASINMKSLVVGEQPPGYPADAYHYILMRILMAARAHDLQAIDGPYLQIRNTDGFREVARRAAALGYDGKWVLHPDQIAVANEVFSPSQEDYDHAELILDAYDWCTSHAGGAKGSAMLGDEMIDEASRKMALVIAGKGRAAGMTRTSKFEPPQE